MLPSTVEILGMGYNPAENCRMHRSCGDAAAMLMWRESDVMV